jgi:hypothetical protein
MKINFYKLVSSAKQSLFALVLTVFLGTAYSQTTYTFNYTGSIQTINLPQAGNYKIECWGGNGGDGTYYSVMTPNNLIDGGKGGYSVGFITIPNPVPTLYVAVGGRGSNLLAGGNPGGYNGGGNSSSAPYQAGSGGGASHVATASGLLNSLSGNQAAVLIVAGGGGGGGNQSLGGDGGGLNGVTPPTNTQYLNRTPGGGGTQNTGGTCYTSGFGAAFGQGGSTTQNLAGGGGGGWYGGCSGDNSTAGGGGSGYIGGVNNGTTTATGTPSFVPNPEITGHGFVKITRLCNISLNASSNPICIGQSVTLSTDAVSGISWTGGSSANSIVVSPSVTTSYSVAGTSTANCQTSSMITITVNPLPVLSTIVTPTTLCVGKTATIVANGASTYTWNGGPTGSSQTFNPAVSTIYNLSGTSQFGCLNTATVAVNVNTNSITVMPSVSVCKGSAITLTASGAVSYTWSSGSNFATAPVSPNTSTTYTVEGIDAFGCELSSMVAVTVNNSPTITASASKSTICKNEGVTLSASGTANTYTWSNNATGPAASLNLPVDIVYSFTVTGEDNNGCTATAIVTVSVNKCVGINEFGKAGLEAKVYPNPVGNTLTVELNNSSAKLIEITDLSGRLILSRSGNGETMDVDVAGLANGVYYVKLRSDNMTEVFKIVKGN